MKDFIYTAMRARVVFGAGKLAAIRDEVETIGSSRALVLCTPPQRAQAERVAKLLGSRLAGIHDGAEMHVPIEGARKARELAAELKADCAVAIGGGSTIGLGKAIALEAPIPIIAIPTTYAGSEMTPIYGITEGGLKRTGRDVRVLHARAVRGSDSTHAEGAGRRALRCDRRGGAHRRHDRADLRAIRRVARRRPRHTFAGVLHE
jgi:maleylacetate reductase